VSEEQPVVRVRDLHKAFGDLSVLEGVDLQLHPRENLVVLGRSGTGKSVLIKLIIGLLTPDRGEVEVLGEDPHSLTGRALDELRLRVGFAFQHAALYDSMSVYDNLVFSPRLHTDLPEAELRDRAEEVLDAVGLVDHIDHMPAELSGGQRKRVGVARTLMMRPEVIFYDEPTSGLDPRTAGELNELVMKVRETYDTASILITHDLTCARQTGDRVAMLHEGTVHAVGPFQELFDTDDPHLRAFYDYNHVHTGAP